MIELIARMIIEMPLVTMRLKILYMVGDFTRANGGVIRVCEGNPRKGIL